MKDATPILGEAMAGMGGDGVPAFSAAWTLLLVARLALGIDLGPS